MLLLWLSASLSLCFSLSASFHLWLSDASCSVKCVSNWQACQMTDWPLFSPWALQLWLWPSTTPSSLLSLAYWSAWAMCFGPGCPYRRLFIFHIWYSPSVSVFLPPACGQLSRRRTIRLMFLLLAFMFNAMGLFVGAEVIVPNCQGNKRVFLHFEFAVLCCCFVCTSHGLLEKDVQWVWGDREIAPMVGQSRC